MVKKLIFALAVLALAVAGVHPLQAGPFYIPKYCTEMSPCTYQGQCGYDSYTGTYLGVCHNGSCYCY